jgi:RNA-directed DNA polymerase
MMKRSNNLLPAICDPDNLRLAFWKARKGKAYKSEVLGYATNLHDNLLELQTEIRTGQIKVGDYRYFKIFDPKERQICASAFSEQVLHHALMNVCHPVFEGAQIEDSFASRPSKGVHAALALAKKHTRRHRYFLKLDVRKFFDSIHQETLKLQLAKKFKEPLLLNIFGQIIDSYEATPGRGVPIGNLSSQYFANHFLAELDRFIKQNLNASAYIRYMDDMVIWHDDRDFLRLCRQKTQEYAQTKLKVELKPPLLNFCTAGLPFLGYVLRPYHTRLGQISSRRFVKKYKQIEQKYQSGEWSEEQCQRHILPLLAVTHHADSFGFRKNIIYSYLSEQG